MSAHSDNSMRYICEYYKVPAKVGGLVLWTGGGGPSLGRIMGGDGEYVIIKLDHHRYAQRFHPTHELVYLVSFSQSVKSDDQLAAALRVASHARRNKAVTNA